MKPETFFRVAGDMTTGRGNCLLYSATSISDGVAFSDIYMVVLRNITAYKAGRYGFLVR